MPLINPYQEKYRIILIGIGKNTDEERESFCSHLSGKYSISHSLLRKIVDQCPIVIKKNITRKKAESLAKILKSFGARVWVEVKKDAPPISLEFQNVGLHQLVLESASLRTTQSGAWNLVGRVKNIASDTLNDIWVLIQLFGNFEEFLTFEQVPFAFNPLPPGETVPFKAIFDGDLSIQKISIAFKNASGMPLAALDRRKKVEWMRVEWEEGDEAVMSIELTKPPQLIPFKTPNEETRKDASSGLLSQDLQPLKPEVIQFQVESPLAETPKPPENPIEEPPPKIVSGTTEITEKTEEILWIPFEKEKEEIAEVPPPLPFYKEEVIEWEKQERISESDLTQENQPAPAEVPPLDVSAFEEASQLIQEIVEKKEEREGDPFSFHWMEEFIRSIEAYYRGHPDPFLSWFRSRQDEDKLKNSFSSLLTILVHARFDQIDEPTKGLENTKRVFQLAPNPNIPLDEIPPLEAPRFFLGEQWRDLFHRAIPRLQQVCRDILQKKKWEASEIQRLIQVIPHMSEKSSRKSLRWISELIPERVDIDFSNMPVSLNKNLYRVTCRLGVMDPHFDFYHDSSSMGDLKIQAFAKSAFPQDPSRIETPMTWVGSEEDEGHCLSFQPRCEGCLFERFCKKLYLHFDPSEKGMGRRKNINLFD
ncbi:MAG: hypothetical protein A2156_12925 [Deltaproteobacteria bacterium RBG_16_48_10]|nr:MAG: hypothetical protein A2156_12925 [Deltaproteobacteria bacterium RBG_16_48_10]